MLQYHEKKIILLTCGAFIILCLVIVVGIIPTFKKINSLNKDIFTLQHDLELRYARTSNLHKSKINLGKIKQFTDDSKKLFVEPNHELDLILFLEQTAKNRRLQQNISLLGKQQIKSVKLMSLNTQIQVIGTYGDVLNYLIDIENAPLSIHLTSISLSQGGPNNSNLLSSLNKTEVFTLTAQATAYVNP